MSNPFGIVEHYEADILGYSAQRELQLLVEVKAGQSWAATNLAGWDADQWHDFFVEQSNLWLPEPVKPSLEPNTWFAEYYFMLATPGQIALWQPGAAGFRQPDYVVEATRNMDVAIDTQRVPLVQLPPESFQRITFSWLFYSLATPAEELKQRPASRWLIDSGLYTAIHQGELVKSADDKLSNYAAVR